MIARVGKIWHYDFTIEGRRYRGSCGTEDKRQATAYAAQQHKMAYDQQKLGIAAAVHMTLQDACTRFYEEIGKGTAYGENAQAYHIVALERGLGAGRRLADLDDAAVAQAIGKLRAEREWSAATTNRHLATLQAVCVRARDTWGVTVGPWQMKNHRLAEPPGREVFLGYEEARAIVEAIVPHARGPVLLDLLTGLRKANLLGITHGQVDRDLRRLVLRQKGNRRLAVSLVPGAMEIINRLWQDDAAPDARIFTYGHPAVTCPCSQCRNPAKRGKPILDIRQSLSSAAARSGGRNARLRFHDLRHTFASLALAETGNLELVREMLGHADIKTTKRYAHLLPGARERAAEAIGARLMAPSEEATT